MKFLICTFAALLMSAQAFAESKISIEATADASIYVKHHSMKRGGKCKGGPGPTYRNDVREYKKAGNAEITNSLTFSLGVGTEKIASMYTFNAAADILNNGDVSTLKLTLTNSSKKHQETSWRSGCENNHWNQYLQNGAHSARITFSYKVPSGVWGLRITESGSNEVFATTPGKVVEGPLLDPRTTRSRIVWAKPGSTISRNFEISGTMNKQTSASYSISFEPVGPEFKKDEITGALQILSDGIGENGKLADEFIQTSFRLLRSSRALKEAMTTMGTTRLFKLQQLLFSIAESPKLLDRVETTMLVKSVSTVLAYEIATNVTESLAAYCKVTDVNLPYTKGTAKVAGARYATFLMTRIKDRIETSSTGIYTEFVSHLRDLQKKNMTYQDASKNPEVRSGLERSFKVVRQYGKTDARPYASAFQDFLDFYSVYSAVGTDDSTAKLIAADLNTLNELEKSFLLDMFEHVQQYGPTNTKPINADSLAEKLDQIRILSDKAARNLKDHTLFLSIEGEAKTDSLIGMLTSFRTHVLNVMHTEEKVDQFGSAFEPIRRAYQDPARTETAIKTVDSCIYDGAQ